MIKAVLFDFGGVLTEKGKKGFIAELIAELYHKHPTEIDIDDWHYRLRRGQASEDSFFAALNQRYGGDVSKDMLVERAQRLQSPSDEVYELAAQLRAHGLQTGILSNIFSMNAEQLRRDGWYDGFDPVILSCEEGYAKPDEHFYRIAMERTGVRPEEILFIDDQDKCLPPARQLGWRVVQAVSPVQIVADVRTVIRQENGLEL